MVPYEEDLDGELPDWGTVTNDAEPSDDDDGHESDDIPGLQEVSDSSESGDDMDPPAALKILNPHLLAAASFLPSALPEGIHYVDDFVPNLSHESTGSWWNRFHREWSPSILDNLRAGEYHSLWTDTNPWGRLRQNTGDVELPNSGDKDDLSRSGRLMPDLEDLDLDHNDVVADTISRRIRLVQDLRGSSLPVLSRHNWLGTSPLPLDEGPLDAEDHMPAPDMWRAINTSAWMDLQEWVFDFYAPDDLDRYNQLLSQVVRCRLCQGDCSPTVFQRLAASLL